MMSHEYNNGPQFEEENPYKCHPVHRNECREFFSFNRKHRKKLEEVTVDDDDVENLSVSTECVNKNYP